MNTPPPALSELLSALAPICAAAGISGSPLSAVRREENEYARSYLSEVVVCCFADGNERRLFLKYMTTLGEHHRDHGMRGGPAYEANVYRLLLRDRIRPAFYGLHTSATGAMWLILEWLEDTVPMDLAEDEDAIFKSATWLGKFHAAQEIIVAAQPPPGVRVCDAGFYRGWARRTNEFAGEWHSREPWLAGVCADFDRCVGALLASPATLVHGEFYPHNILYRDGEIFTVDWESAAIGAGEIDLASLAEGWGEETEDECERRYRAARWPGGAPEAFSRTLAAAHVYTHMRWMGEHPAWRENEDEAQYQLGELRRWAERFAGVGA
jgi:aminoglycoside phosphotransferase (APT) family kinase protein